MAPHGSYRLLLALHGFFQFLADLSVQAFVTQSRGYIDIHTVYNNMVHNSLCQFLLCHLFTLKINDAYELNIPHQNLHGFMLDTFRCSTEFIVRSVMFEFKRKMTIKVSKFST